MMFGDRVKRDIVTSQKENTFHTWDIPYMVWFGCVAWWLPDLSLIGGFRRINMINPDYAVEINFLISIFPFWKLPKYTESATINPNKLG